MLDARVGRNARERAAARRGLGEPAAGARAISAVLVESAIERAALTAIMWFWTPASPHRAAASPTEAIDFCLERLGAAGLTCPMPHAKLVRTIEERIR